MNRPARAEHEETYNGSNHHSIASCELLLTAMMRSHGIVLCLYRIVCVAFKVFSMGTRGASKRWASGEVARSGQPDVKSI